MARPTIYLDECVDHDVIPFLRARGVMIETAQAHGQTQRRISDDAQVDFATAHGLVILTTNAEHFRKEHRRRLHDGIPHAGMITLAAEALHQPRFFLRCAMLIDWLERDYPDPRNRLLRWSELQALLDRREIALPGYDAEHIAYASGRTTIPPDALQAEVAHLAKLAENVGHP